MTTILILAVGLALIFDYINGFHDAANAVATVVATRVLTPFAAVAMAAVLNMVGAFYSTNVATTIAKGLVDPNQATQVVVLAAIVGGIFWNLLTWFYGIPSSSSHALIGGLVGAAVTHGGLGVIVWKGPKEGLDGKVIIPLFTSPIVGFFIAFFLLRLLAWMCTNARPVKANAWFRHLQLVSSALMAFSHGSNDAQKSMGIITMALVSAGVLAKPIVPPWVILSCAAAMALGTLAGGWRVMRTLGHRIVRLEPIHGFAAEMTASTVLLTTAHFGIPVSTTHVISSSILGVGAAKRWRAVRWSVAQRMVFAWVVTLPAAALTSALAYLIFTWCGLR